MKRIALLQFHKDWEICRNRVRLLRSFNPGLEIYGLYGGDAERLPEVEQAFGDELNAVYHFRHPDHEWKWKNTDLAVRSWYRDFGANVDFDIVHSVQWDLLLLAPLDSVYRGVPPRALGLTGMTSVDAIADRWHWTLNEPHKTELVQLRDFVKSRFGHVEPFHACLGPGYCLPREFLDAYASADVPELGHDEIRLPLYAAILGFDVADTGFYPRWFDSLEERFFNATGDDIDERLIRLELSRPRGRRAFHPFRREFALSPKRAAPARNSRGQSEVEETRDKAAGESFRVVAIIAAYNEADIISPLIEHLVGNGIDAYLIDNRSTDDTIAEARRWLGKGLLEIETFPKEAAAGDGAPGFDWEGILRRKEEIAQELGADWYIHNDADEFREPPWPAMSLKDAIRWVDRLGYNCIDFRVLNFRPVDSGFRAGTDPREHFTRWEEPILHDRVRLNCWKAQTDPVSLAASGGHEVRFPGRRVFPIRFLLRHYPVRSQEHGERKVFDERKKRFLERERAKGWHVQYDGIDESGHSFVGDPEKLNPYDADRVRLDLLVGEERTRDLAVELEARRLDVAGLQAAKHEVEKHAANLERDRQKLTGHLVERERHAANLETLKAEAERHAANVEKDRAEIVARLGERERQFGNLDSLVDELRRHAAGLEKDREVLARRIEELEAIRADREARVAGAEAKVAELERHATGLEKDRETLAAHIVHLETVRADLSREAGRRQELEARVQELETLVPDLEARFVAMRIRANSEEARAGKALRELSAIQRSTSWRLTEPFRRVGDWMRALFRS
jgi:glycosyltransferase involved in cell wall biosynthesis